MLDDTFLSKDQFTVVSPQYFSIDYKLFSRTCFICHLFPSCINLSPHKKRPDAKHQALILLFTIKQSYQILKAVFHHFGKTNCFSETFTGDMSLNRS